MEELIGLLLGKADKEVVLCFMGLLISHLPGRWRVVFSLLPEVAQGGHGNAYRPVRKNVMTGPSAF